MDISKLVCVDNSTGEEFTVAAPPHAGFKARLELLKDPGFVARKAELTKLHLELSKMEGASDEALIPIIVLSAILNAAHFIEVAAHIEAPGDPGVNLADKLGVPSEITLKSCEEFLIGYSVSVVEQPPADKPNIDENPSGTQAGRS